MVEDSIAEKFSSSSVSVAGLDVYDANDAEIKWLIDTAHITFPIAKNGDSIRLFYAAYYYSIVVIDKNGIVQFIADSLDITEASDKKSVSDAAAKVRNLLGSRVVRPAATTALKGRNSVGVPRCYTLSGQRIPQLMTSVRAGIVVLRRDGKGTEFARFKKPNP